MLSLEEVSMLTVLLGVCEDDGLLARHPEPRVPGGQTAHPGAGGLHDVARPPLARARAHRHNLYPGSHCVLNITVLHHSQDQFQVFSSSVKHQGFESLMLTVRKLEH